MTTHKRKTQKKQQRGGDAYHHAIAVYGDRGDQHAIAGSNVIHMNAPPPTPAIGGSSKVSSKSRSRKTYKRQRKTTCHKKTGDRRCSKYRKH
jgi:hypothetical protein